MADSGVKAPHAGLRMTGPLRRHMIDWSGFDPASKLAHCRSNTSTCQRIDSKRVS